MTQTSPLSDPARPGGGPMPLLLWPWAIAVVALLVLPHVLTANSTITILNQMAITVIFALSYNMLLGQAGMLSFGHAIYLGFGGFACLHAMNYFQAGGWPVPLPVLPLFAGLFSLGMAIVIGAFSTRRTGTVFAMISLGVVELVASFSIVFYLFFRGGGIGGDRTFSEPFFGVEFIRQIEVYYLIAAWLILSVAVMYAFTRTPLGRMANAVRDNAERAEFVGYSARWIRFYSFCAAGFFAGVAGGLSALNYEISTAESLTVEASGTIIMIAFLGGVGVFFGPILGAILFTFLQTVLSMHTDLWQLYVGILFLAAVMFFPSGLAGLLMLHLPVLKAGRVRQVAWPYVAVIAPGLVAVAGFAALIEMVFHLRSTIAGTDGMVVFWIAVQPLNWLPWIVAGICALGGFWVCRRNVPPLAAAWQGATDLRS